jgi:formylglycine-generating enzyme required for sulfatase activity
MAADYANYITVMYNQTFGTSLNQCYRCTSSGSTSADCITLSNPYQCDGFRLPTEVEWEYAARSGSTSTYWTSTGGGNLLPANVDSCSIGWTLDDGSSLGDYAWYCARNIVDETKEVAQNLPNDFELYDMHGNVWEWCHDGYFNLYPVNASTNYVYLSSGSGRLLRGGAWSSEPSDVRVANRHFMPQFYRLPTIGIRLVRTQ